MEKAKLLNSRDASSRTKTKSIKAKSMVFNIFKSIAAFLNTDGGKLIIELINKRQGLDEIGKQFQNYDKMDLFLMQLTLIRSFKRLL